MTMSSGGMSSGGMSSGGMSSGGMSSSSNTIPNTPSIVRSTPGVSPGPWKDAFVPATSANTGTNAPSGTQWSSPASAQPSRMAALKDADSLSKAIKIAASNDAAIGGKEMNQLMKINGGKSVQDIQAKLDKINSKAGAKRSYIGFKGNAYNKLMSGGFDTTEDRRSRMYGGLMNQMFGDGAGEKFGFMNPMDRSGNGRIARGQVGYTTPGIAPEQLAIASGNNTWSGYLDKYLSGLQPETTVDTTNTGGTGDGGTGGIQDGTQTVDAPTIAEPVNPGDAMIGGGAGGVINGSGSFRTRGKKGKGSNASGKMGLLQTKMASTASGIGNNYGNNWSLYNRSLAS